MKKLYTLFFLTMIISVIASAQTTVTLKLNANEEDATIDDFAPANNHPNEIEYASAAWTINGTPVIWRNLFKFNLNYIPSNATITSAYLNLYFAPQNNFGWPGHSSLTNSNESIVEQVTSAWSENSVTWNNQPTTTSLNSIILLQSVNDTANYQNMDVTAMVQDMFYNPSSNFGFMLKLTNEAYYAEMIFASGDNPDSSRHPELVVTYSTPCTVLTIDANGEDATIDDYGPGNNYPNEIEYFSGSWTINGTPVIWRNLFKFDFSSIPVNATIQSADLNLFYAPNNNFYADDTSLTSSNESTLQKVNSSWTENTVTWNNQPSTDTIGQVILPPTTFPNQDYLNMNVTGMVQSMVANPSTNFGFMLKLTTENYYARMIFASGDNPVDYLHPQLQVCFTVPSAIEDLTPNSVVNIYPNPSSGNFSVSWNRSVHKFNELRILNTLGQTVVQRNIFSLNKIEIDLTRMSQGIYFLQLSGSDGDFSKKITVQ
ncbi:MAG TPA: DNRLRE domain-containing protein [Bacteroidia bacterium]|nr:DNRLRE domain-containing protein [Bacteroidia bacterium]